MLFSLCLIFLLTQGGTIQYRAFENSSCTKIIHTPQNLPANKCSGHYFARCISGNTVKMEYYSDKNSCKKTWFAPLVLDKGQCKYHKTLKKYMKVTFTDACNHLSSTSNKARSSPQASPSSTKCMLKDKIPSKCAGHIGWGFRTGKYRPQANTWYTYVRKFTADGTVKSGKYEHFQQNFYCKGTSNDCKELGPACDENGQALSCSGPSSGSVSSSGTFEPSHDYELFANKYECSGSQVPKGSVPKGNAGVLECAKRCKRDANMFTVGTNDYGGSGCSSTSCNCVCSKAATTRHTCSKRKNTSVRLYRYKKTAGKAVLVARGKECKGSERKVRNVDPGKAGIQQCANNCKFLATAFVIGQKCTSSGCNCFCETAAKNGFCELKHAGYNLYTYGYSVGTEATVGKEDCNDVCSDLTSSDKEKCIENCWGVAEAEAVGNEMSRMSSGIMHVVVIMAVSIVIFLAGKFVGDKHIRHKYVKAPSAVIELE